VYSNTFPSRRLWGTVKRWVEAAEWDFLIQPVPPDNSIRTQNRRPCRSDLSAEARPRRLPARRAREPGL